jgi:hypothetical protein
MAGGMPHPQDPRYSVINVLRPELAMACIGTDYPLARIEDMKDVEGKYKDTLRDTRKKNRMVLLSFLSHSLIS